MENTDDVLKKRKQRVVKNALVDIDFVAVQPGVNYCDWIKITKQKLKERDRMLLEIKLTKIKSIVNNELKRNTTSQSKIEKNFSIKQEIIDHTLFTLSNKVNEWNGINIQRIKSSLDRYRDYFCISKKWWDQTKTKLFGSVFWLMVFKQIEQFVNNIHLLLKIIGALFNSSIKYDNTKLHSLINGGTILCSSEIHKYLYNINNSLTIKQWIKNNNNCNQKAKIISNKIRHQLQKIVAEPKQLENQMMPHNTCIRNINYETIGNNKPLAINQCANIFNRGNVSIIMNNNNINCNNNINNINNINNNNSFMMPYGGYHQPMHYVLDERYSPFISNSIIYQNNNTLYISVQNPNQYGYMRNNINKQINFLSIPTNNSCILFQQ